MSRWSPYLVLLACPLMMIFMMRGMMRGHHDPAAHGQAEPSREPATGGGPDQRLAELEAEVAELRAERDSARPGKG